MAKQKDDYAPCQLVEHEAGQYSLIFTDFDPTQATFADHDLEGGGYDWAAVVDALVRMKARKLQKKIEYDPEAGMFAAYSNDQDALKTVAGLIRAAIADPALLSEAIEKADPDMLD